MRDRLTGIFLLLAVGWFLGYLHHYYAVRPGMQELQESVLELERRVVELRSSVPLPKKVQVKTTAYSNDDGSIDVEQWRDGRTATNKVARRGHIAADWRLFPPGTRLYVPGYGEAVVEDRGGQVKGYHLDLFVDSREEALRWGIRNLDVYVIEKGRRSASALRSMGG
jgi:3D (Asp-Asp-Asp) domain-containing protein